MLCIHQIRSTVFQQLGCDRIRADCLVVFQVFRQINVNTIISQIDVLVAPIRSLRSNVLQNVISISPAHNASPLSGLVCKHSWLSAVVLDGSLSGSVFCLVHFCKLLVLYLLVFLCSRWCLSLLSGLFLPVFYIIHPSLVVELAHLRVQTRARRSTLMRRPYPSVCRLRNVSVVAALCCWHGIFLLSTL
jgi:hypothetical protein